MLRGTEIVRQHGCFWKGWAKSMKTIMESDLNHEGTDCVREAEDAHMRIFIAEENFS